MYEVLAANGYRLAEGRRKCLGVRSGGATTEPDYLSAAARTTPGFWQADVSRRTRFQEICPINIYGYLQQTM
jgi:hypothetical protein